MATKTGSGFCDFMEFIVNKKKVDYPWTCALNRPSAARSGDPPALPSVSLLDM